MGKLEEDPKCNGIVWREVVKLITYGPVVYQFWVIRFSIFIFCSIHLQVVDMNTCLKRLPRASTNCKLSLMIKLD